ncbi:hypothetical protein BDV23DRAFT_152000 [Aspergillus alliaceus]|uniref:Uncharacterized protein n=1 Tax=Petromyces alliaceus TaxID=209559 RepID=A0A5N7CDW0_PETAA|nr:hypothetical protein BDV23DRAFT_152000 [Aspergillus alliaceus]
MTLCGEQHAVDLLMEYYYFGSQTSAGSNPLAVVITIMGSHICKREKKCCGGKSREAMRN